MQSDWLELGGQNSVAGGQQFRIKSQKFDCLPAALSFFPVKKINTNNKPPRDKVSKLQKTDGQYRVELCALNLGEGFGERVGTEFPNALVSPPSARSFQIIFSPLVGETLIQPRTFSQTW